MGPEHGDVLVARVGPGAHMDWTQAKMVPALSLGQN